MNMLEKSKDKSELRFNGNKVYHAGDKPTIEELGASSVDHNHDSTYLPRTGGTITGDLRIAATNQPTLRFVSANNSTHIQSGNVGDQAGNLSITGFYGGALNKLDVSISSGHDFKVNGSTVYTKAIKPTPAEIGALSSSGGTLSGELTMNAPINFTGQNALYLGGIPRFMAGSGTNSTSTYIGAANNSIILRPRGIGDASREFTVTNTGDLIANGSLFINGTSGIGLGDSKTIRFRPGGADNKSTVLSADNSTIYLRPTGDGNGAAETTISNSGLLTVNGNIQANGTVNATGYLKSNGNGKSMVIGTGGTDVFLYNTKANAYLQLKDDGTLSYADKKIYHEGFKPTASDLGAAPTSHTHPYLPLSGGTVDGTVTLKSISIKQPDGAFTKSAIRGINGDTNGVGLSIGAGGLTVVGSGESADALVTAESLGGSSENLYLSSDNAIYFKTSCNTIANRVTASLSTNGTFDAPNIQVGGNNVYHTGRKPTAAEIGAAAASHTHSYLPLSGGTITGASITIGAHANGLEMGSNTNNSWIGVKGGGFLNLYSDYITYKGNRLYHQGYKPTTTEIGALSARQSARDFTNGALIKTSIPGSNGVPFYLKIEGNSYLGTASFYIVVQGYQYNGDIINFSAMSMSGNNSFPIIKAFNYNGELWFWLPYGTYWQGITVSAFNAVGAGNANNLCYSVDNAAMPTTGVTRTKDITIKRSYTEEFRPTAADVGARPSSWVPTWSDVSGKPSTFAPIIGTASNQAAAGNHNHDTSYLKLKKSVANIDTEAGHSIIWHKPSSPVGWPSISGGNNAIAIMTLNTHEGGYYSQLGLDSATNKLVMRSRSGSSTYGSWATVYTDQNKPSAADIGAKAASWTPTWNDVSGKPSTFYTHPNDANTRHVTDSEKSTWNGKAAGNHVHKSIEYSDTRDQNYNPNAHPREFKVTFQRNSTNGVNDGGTYYTLMHIPRYADASGGLCNQIAFTDNNNMWIRKGATDTTWGTWYKVYHSGAKPTAADIGALASNANAVSASKLATARSINGTNFDGSANITTANWGTARTLTVGNTGKSVNGAGNVSWSLSEIGAAASSHTHTTVGSYIGVSNTTNNNGYGISLYGGAVAGAPSYGFMFQGTGSFGTHGSVTGDWATYFTMAGATTRGWIFKSGNGSGGNVASISATGVITGADVKVGSNTVYHTGRKPSAADVGAAPASHSHSYLPLAGGQIDGKLVVKRTAAAGWANTSLEVASAASSALAKITVHSVGKTAPALQAGDDGDNFTAVIERSGQFRVSNNNGWIKIGAANTSYCHFHTSLSQYYFDSSVRVRGDMFAGPNFDQWVIRSSAGQVVKNIWNSNNNYMHVLTENNGDKGVTWWDSDIKIKKDIVCLNEKSEFNIPSNLKSKTRDSKEIRALDVVNKIEHFEFKKFSGTNQEDEYSSCGYIAQQLEGVNPEFIFEVKQTPVITSYEKDEDGELVATDVPNPYYDENDPVIRNPKPSSIIPYMTKAIQELDSENKSLRRELLEIKEALKLLTSA